MEILQCDFPGFWVTWHVTLSHTGHLIGLARGPVPLQIEAFVEKKTNKKKPTMRAVWVHPSGDSEGGGFSV